MNKFLALSVLAMCIALAAGARINRRRGESVQIAESGADAFDYIDTTSNKGRRRRNRGGFDDVLVEEQVFEPAGLRRRGNGIRNAQRVIESENARGARGAQEGAIAESSLKAGQRNLDSVQALLQKKQARQERLDAKQERKERKKAAARAAAGEKLKAQAALDYETYEKAENFHNLDAAASEASSNDFGLQIVSSNDHKAEAALSESSGDRYASGTKLRAQEAIDAESFANEEALHEDEFEDNALLSAAAASEDLLNAQEAAKSENEEFIDAQNAQQVGRGFQQESDFFGGGRSNIGFGSSDIFGDSGFFKK